MSRALKHCSEEMRQFLSLDRFAPNKLVSDIVAELQAMSPEQRRDLNRDQPDPLGYNDIRAEMEKLLTRHGRRIRVRDFVASDLIGDELWMCDLGVGD